MTPLSTDTILERARDMIRRRVKRGFWNAESALEHSDIDAKVMEIGLHEWAHCVAFCRRAGLAPKPMDSIVIGRKIERLAPTESDDQECETIALSHKWLELFGLHVAKRTLIDFSMHGMNIYTWDFTKHRMQTLGDLDAGNALWKLAWGLWPKQDHSPVQPSSFNERYGVTR